MFQLSKKSKCHSHTFLMHMLSSAILQTLSQFILIKGIPLLYFFLSLFVIWNPNFFCYKENHIYDLDEMNSSITFFHIFHLPCYICELKLNLWLTAPRGPTPVNQTSATDWQIAVQWEICDQHYAPCSLIMLTFLIRSTISQSSSYPNYPHKAGWIPFYT